MITINRGLKTHNALLLSIISRYLSGSSFLERRLKIIPDKIVNKIAFAGILKLKSTIECTVILKIPVNIPMETPFLKSLSETR